MKYIIALFVVLAAASINSVSACACHRPSAPAPVTPPPAP